MLYPYVCPSDHRFEVVKSVREIDSEEKCPECGEVAKRTIAVRQSFSNAGDWRGPEYCPALGQVVKSDAHRRKLARERGLEEVGNENVNKIAKENSKQIERAKEKDYEQLARVAYNEGFSQ